MARPVCSDGIRYDVQHRPSETCKKKNERSRTLSESLFRKYSDLTLVHWCQFTPSYSGFRYYSECSLSPDPCVRNEQGRISYQGRRSVQVVEEEIHVYREQLFSLLYQGGLYFR